RPRGEALGRKFLRTEPLCPRPLESPSLGTGPRDGVGTIDPRDRHPCLPDRTPCLRAPWPGRSRWSTPPEVGGASIPHRGSAAGGRGFPIWATGWGRPATC